MPSPEDVIIQKLRWGRPKDLIDAEAVAGVQGSGLDWKYVESWCEAHGTLPSLAQVKSAIPPDLLALHWALISIPA